MTPSRHNPVRLGARLIGSIAVLLVASGAAGAAERFPPPDFSTGYTLPRTEVPPAATPWQEYVDVGALVLALGAASWLGLKARSRRGVFVLSIASLLYFGFWRMGCVCSIGAIQNVALALCQPGYALPFAAAAFFFLPLAFSLFFGRTFCGGVCPLGAIQDLVLVRPLRVPGWLDGALRMGPYVYLGLAVLLAATGSAFVICEYDPFVPFFRMSGGSGILLLGAGLLILGMAVGRPYCRYLCPYGVLLSWTSRLSRSTVSIAPDECVRCRLCADECPFGAIEVPEPAAARPARPGAIAAMSLAIPILAGIGLLAGLGASGALATMNPTVRLADRVWLEETGAAAGRTESSAAFRSTGAPTEELFESALGIRDGFRAGGAVLGAFLGLVLGIRLLASVLPRRHPDYRVHRGDCVACARCFLYCPQEHERLKKRGVLVTPAEVTRQV